MAQPTVELYPLRPAVRSDGPTTLDVLLRIIPPMPEQILDRPPLNIGLVLDRSGSMGGNAKLPYAIAAARMLIEQLSPRDRIALTIFDDAVQTIASSELATDRQRLLDLLPDITPGGSTALHAGWIEGVAQVQPHTRPEALNRVLLLTDGLANVGEINPDVIATDVKQATLRGVSTSTMGVGADYNEDLIEAMARSGDGNYYYIQSPDQLPAAFQTELLGLLALVGRQSRLTCELGEGVTLTDVLNDLERDPDGRLILPNLIGGLPVEVVLRFSIAPQSEPTTLVRFGISYESASDGPQVLSAELRLPVATGAALQEMPADSHVLERGALQMSGRLKRQATRSLDRGDIAGTQSFLNQATDLLRDLPVTESVTEELADLKEVQEQLEQGDLAGTRKSANYQHYRRSNSK